ncbi:Hypp1789 [Branchiostoma lanceolatum]|uniref:Hypp1789 protein n=1 Tax=Branchiostoma lanceolatum TaxID=7740 RepID=A0A8J9ZNJ0_BRALA|nr:Hypp1789 [Branchiostoma lanceolatum]
MKFQVLFAIILLSATTSVISGAPVLPGGASVVSGAPVRPGGDQAVEKGFFDNIQDSYWQAMALQHQLAQLAEQIQEADDDDSSEMAHLTAQWHQLQAQAQPIIDQVYG